MDELLKGLIERAGALGVGRALVEGHYSRSYGEVVKGKLGVNAKAAGYIAVRASGLADLWSEISRYEEAEIVEVVVGLLREEQFERAVSEKWRLRCLADAERFVAALTAGVS